MSEPAFPEIDPRKWKVNDAEKTVTLPADELRVLQDAYHRELVRLAATGGHAVRP